MFHATFSPPAPAWRTTNRPTDIDDPRSTCHHFVASSAHHLSVLPPETLPLTALAGPSLALQDESAVAVLPSATFEVPEIGAYASNSSIRAAVLVSFAGVVMFSRM